MRIYMRRLLDEREDRGFTLIELLVVIIIIGILAAIAIPVFLDQREKSYDASAKADLKNLATFEEIYLNDFQTYGDATDLIADEPRMEVSANDTMHIYYIGDTGYCLEANYTGAGQIWYYDSRAGGIQPSHTSTCPVTPTSGAGVVDGGQLN
jgi:type IV pilus assembly protein PilA